MSSLSDKAAEEDADSAAYLKKMANDPYVRKVVKRLLEDSIRKQLPKKLPCLIREFFRDGSRHTPQEAIQGIKRELCYRRLTPLLKKTIKSGLNAAVRRRILQRQSGGYVICNRRFGNYDDDFLETLLLRVIGHSRVERSGVPKLLARHLGFKQTTPAIKETTHSLINLLVRSGIIEKDGQDWIRRM
jgi:hypothetical protein